MPRRNRVQTVHIRRRFFLRNFLSTLSLMLIPVLAVNALLAVYIRGETRGDAERQSLQTLDYMKSSFDMVFDELFYYRNLFVSNSNFNLLLISTLSERPLTYSDAVSLRELYSYMSGLSGIKPSLHSLYFGKAESDKMIVGGLRLDIDGYIDSEWYSLYMAEETGAPYWIERREIRDYAFETEAKPVLTVFQRLKYGGVMVVNLDLQYFDQLLSTSTTYEGQALAVLDEFGDIILQNEGVAGLPEGWLAGISGGDGESGPVKGYQITSLESSRYGLTYLSLIPGSSIYRLSDLIYWLSLLVGGVAVLASAGLAFLYTRRSYRQISRIIDAFDDAEQGRELPLPSEIREGDAYSYILHNTINTFLRQSYLEVQLSRRRYEMLSAQLAALQYQINPHFLFNTLQSIDLEIVRDHPGSRASRMVAQLSDLLRYSLGDPQELIRIADEIAITKSYVEIQQYRHSNRFRVFWDYREACLGQQILRMLLQPLIENVISHGMRPEGETTLIRVRIRLTDGCLHFRVTDNGTGISPARLGEIRGALDAEGTDMESLHIGLRNIHRRLRIRYPGEPGLRIWSREGLGAVISFRVPCPGGDTSAFFPGEETEG